MGEVVARKAKTSAVFQAVQTVMLGHGVPTVADAVRELEKQECGRLIVVPLFVAHSSHTLFDVPGVLGVYFSPRLEEALRQESIAIARPRVPVTICEPVSREVLADFAWAQVQKMSQEPKREGVVLLAHGSAAHATLVNNRLREIVTYCAGRAGIDYADWVFADHGPLYLDNAAPAILEALRRKERVLVLGLYVSLSAQDIRVIGTRGSRHEPPQLREAIRNGRVIFSESRLVEEKRLPDWVLEAATAAVGARSVPVSVSTPEP